MMMGEQNTGRVLYTTLVKRTESEHMYHVTYKNGKTGIITNQKGDRINLLMKQGMLSRRQTEWLDTVEKLEKDRDEPDHYTLVKTKDMICNCGVCSAKR